MSCDEADGAVAEPATIARIGFGGGGGADIDTAAGETDAEDLDRSSSNGHAAVTGPAGVVAVRGVRGEAVVDVLDAVGAKVATKWHAMEPSAATVHDVLPC